MDTRRRRQNIIIILHGFVVAIAVAYTILLLRTSYIVHVHDDRIKAIAINESHKNIYVYISLSI